MAPNSSEDSTDQANHSKGASVHKPDWLTPELFHEFLEKDLPNYVKVNKFEVNSAVAPGENFLTVMMRITMEVEMPDSNVESISYMLKVNPRTEEMQYLVGDWHLFEKEQMVYTKYLPKFEEMLQNAGTSVKFGPQLLMPSCKDIKEAIVILEDLRPKGFINVSRRLGLDMQHTEAVLRKLAQFHAASAQYVQEEEEISHLFDRCLASEQDNVVAYRHSIGRALRANLALYGDAQYLEEKLKTYVDNQFEAYLLKTERNPEEFHVLNHGDLWVNNIMFQHNEAGSINETYFIDYQMSRYGPPAHDLLYFLISSTHMEIKLKEFDYFIAFSENLKLLGYQGKIPKLRDIHISLFKHGYWAYAIITNLLTIVLCDPREDVNIDHVLSANDGDDVRMAMFSSQGYVDCMRELLPWLDNRGAFEL
uniref:CHK kinase-like domain-containing protein n=1 Tax=Stomoxys calcitrans TaxID=35570 RepID=A0A1I8PG57_STOCA